jgi:putative ABC transport system permease protein
VEVLLILSALRRNRIGAVLIALQIALTLAIVSNSLFIAHEQVKRMQRPTGIDEADIFSFHNVWIGAPEDLKSRLQTDLTALRSVPGVLDAFATDGLPLLGGGYSTSINRRRDDRSGVTAALYPVDEHALRTLDLHMMAGRWFNAGDVIDWDRRQQSPDAPPTAIVSEALARVLYPGGDALGREVYISGNAITIIGIVARLQAPRLNGQDDAIENSILVPYLWVDTAPLYVVRARPGQRDAALRAAQRKLLEVRRDRVIPSVRPFQETRFSAYKPFRAMSLILTVVSAVLLITTGVGVVGLTSFWVAQRRRHIGIRRALGARRFHILRYFHVENILVVGAGTLAGAGLAVGMNLFIVREFEIARMPVEYILAGMLLLLCLGQLSVIWPALRAAAVPPATAARAA